MLDKLSGGYLLFRNQLPKPKAGIVTLKFNRVNFQETSENVGIVKGERVQLDIILKNIQSASGAA